MLPFKTWPLGSVGFCLGNTLMSRQVLPKYLYIQFLPFAQMGYLKMVVALSPQILSTFGVPGVGAIVPLLFSGTHIFQGPQECGRMSLQRFPHVSYGNEATLQKQNWCFFVSRSSFTLVTVSTRWKELVHSAIFCGDAKKRPWSEDV